MEKLIPAHLLRQFIHDIFCALTAPSENAWIVAEHLVEASLMGHDSHGVSRTLFYADEIKNGRLKPRGPVLVEKETVATAVVNGNFNFGQVCAHRMTEIVISKASQSGVSCVVSRHAHHAGRLGAWTEKIAAAGLIGIGTITSPKQAHWVVPWGGRKGRLSTNPFSWAAPTEGRPIVADFSTSAIAEGKIFECYEKQEPLPPGRVMDGTGRPTRDARAFYGRGIRTRPEGVILPLGHEFGYRAYALALLPVVLAQCLIGEGISDEFSACNACAFMSVNPGFFGDPLLFRQLVQEIVRYMQGTPPAEGFSEVMVPGQPEYRSFDKLNKTGIPLPENTWTELSSLAHSLGVMADNSAP